jgi:hypothetical protein
MTETYYDLLGVAPDASTEEIERAYRERLKQTHPDVSDDEDAAARTRRLIRARDVLTDDTERDRYDRLGHDSYVGDGGGAVGTDPGGGRSDHREGATTTGAGGPTTPRDGVGTATSRGGRRRGSPRASATGGNHATPEWSDADPRHGTDAGAAYTTREEGVHRSRVAAGSQSVVLLSATFLLYPVLLWGATFPPFPLVVNATVAACVVGVVAFLQSLPEVGVVVFGSWSVLAPLGVVALGVDPVSLPAAVAVLGTALPLGLCLLTRSVVRQ